MSRALGFFRALPSRSLDGGGDAPRDAWVEIPGPGVHSLVRDAESGVRIEPGPSAAGKVLARIASLRFGDRARLVLLAGSSSGLRVNGSPACPVTILNSGDLVVLEDEVLLHVSVLTRPYIGPPLEEHLGRECPLCLAPLEAATPEFESVVYVCPACGVPAHFKARIAATGDVVECARISPSCTSCESPRILRASYEFLPQS